MIGDTFIPADNGQWVSEQYERLARVVQDYDPNYELRWIPADMRTTPEDRKRPYVVWDTVANYAVLYASELDTPVDILTRLFDGDNTKGDVLARLDAHNNAQRILDMKEKMDVAEEKMDYVAFLINSKKNYLQLGKGRKVDDQLRPIL